MSRRLFLGLLLAGGSVVCLLVGMEVGYTVQAVSGPSSPAPAAVVYDQLRQDYGNGFPAPDFDSPVTEVSVDAGAAKMRRSTIASGSSAILAECQAAGGNWVQWEKETEPYRSQLHHRIDELKPTNSPDPFMEAQSRPLAGLNDFPLFELGARTHINYLYDPLTLEDFRANRPVVAVDRWLRKRGIDLIFVPVPKMTEVYIEHFLDHCPSDGIVAPSARQTLRDLLEDGVETVDGWRLFRPVRKPDPDYLYNAADTHWAPRGMRVMAREVSDRIGRYEFGLKARHRLPIFTTVLAPYLIDGCRGGIGSGVWSALEAHQQQLAMRFQTTVTTEVQMRDGRPLTEDKNSPVMLIGNSYSVHFRDLLAAQLNMRIRIHAGDGLGTEAFSELLREPEKLDGVRVIVWITTEQHMTKFKPLPKPIADCLNSTVPPPTTAAPSGPSSPP
jgi:hypothetical protein